MPPIEIRPRRATELVDASFQLLRRYYPQLVTVSAITMSPGVLVRILTRDVMSNPQLMTANPGPLFAVGIAALLCVTVCDAVLTIAVSDGYLNGEIDLARAFGTGMRKIISVFLASFFRGLLVLLAAFVVAIGVAIVASLKMPVLFVLIVPLAIPLIAGPSALATIMLMATREPQNMAMWAGALATTMAVATLVLLSGERLQRALGERAMQAIERLMGLILTAIAVEMLLGGIREFVEKL